MRTCLNRLLGESKECEKCLRDYNILHYPNNLNCVKYKETLYDCYEVIEKSSELESKLDDYGE